MDKLPPELIVAVLRELHSTADLKCMRLCCRNLTPYATEILFSEMSISMKESSFASLAAISTHPRLRHKVHRIVLNPSLNNMRYIDNRFYMENAADASDKFPEFDEWVSFCEESFRFTPAKEAEAGYLLCYSLFEQQKALLVTGPARLQAALSALPNFTSLELCFDITNYDCGPVIHRDYCCRLLENIPLYDVTLVNSCKDLLPPVKLDHIFEGHSWSTLEKLSLTNFATTQQELISTLQRQGLRHLKMNSIKLMSGSWYKLFEDLVGGTLETLKIDCLYLLHPNSSVLALEFSCVLQKAKLPNEQGIDRLIMEFLQGSPWSSQLPDSLLVQAKDLPVSIEEIFWLHHHH